MRLNALLAEEGITPEEVAVILHTPKEAKLRRWLPWLAERRPDLFNCYQNNHPKGPESTLKARRFLLAFIGIGDGRHVLEGLYRVEGWAHRSRDDLTADPAFVELAEIEPGPNREEWFDTLATRAIFELARDARLNRYCGRLLVRKRPERAYIRLAETLDAEIAALLEDPALAGPPPPWRELVLTGPEVRALPESWAARLREWRGIYLIADEADGARYVGAAYGAENLLGRWQAHVAGDAGVTAALRRRDPASFRFSILERVSPDMPPEDAVALENTWKTRLHTRAFGLNRN